LLRAHIAVELLLVLLPESPDVWDTAAPEPQLHLQNNQQT
jgi:hypothetical protein